MTSSREWHKDAVDEVVGLHEQFGFRPELKEATSGQELVLRTRLRMRVAAS
jgi:hypothetical protein